MKSLKLTIMLGLALLIGGILVSVSQPSQAANLGNNASISDVTAKAVKIANDPSMHKKMMEMKSKMDKMDKMMKTAKMDDEKKSMMMSEMDKMDGMMDEMMTMMK